MKPLTKPQLRMLKRRGFALCGDELWDVPAVLWLFDGVDPNLCPVVSTKTAIYECRHLNDREKSARYRRTHRPRINAYMRRYKAAKAGARALETL